MSRKQITRKWEVFAGRNKFYCNGRIMTAPHSGVFLFTVTLITVTSILFFIYDCTYLAVNVTIAIPIIGALLFLFTMSALLRTSLTDPGIIPRATPDEAAYVEKQIEVTNSANSPTYRPPPRTKEVLIKGQTVKLKYCFTCKIFRPPRASHCSLCDNCVERFDHHCPWVGNCVGRRNYRFFYMFIISLAFLAVFIFFCAVAHLALITKEDGQFLEAVKQSPASMVVAVVCFFSVWSVLGLAGFHTYLTTTNQTTNEDIKGSFTSKRGQDSFNPYSQGNVCLNCFYILCGPLTPSLIDRRGVATAEYRLEVAKPPVVVTEQVGPMKPYPVQEMPPPRTPELTRVYRQTTENTGMYCTPPPTPPPPPPIKILPFSHSHRRGHFDPACNSKKVAPPDKNATSSDISIRYSNSLPLLPREINNKLLDNNTDNNKLHYETNNENSNSQLLQNSNQNQNNNRHSSYEYSRPYTPPEKRYSANFGRKVGTVNSSGNNGGASGHRGPLSGFIYENIYADGDCASGATNSTSIAGGGRDKNYRVGYNLVRPGIFPKPDFSRLYIQNSFD